MGFLFGLILGSAMSDGDNRKRDDDAWGGFMVFAMGIVMPMIAFSLPDMPWACRALGVPTVGESSFAWPLFYFGCRFEEATVVILAVLLVALLCHVAYCVKIDRANSLKEK